MLERVFTELGLMEGDAQAQQEGQKLLEDVHRAVTDLIQADKQTDKPYSGHWKNKQFARQVIHSIKVAWGTGLVAHGQVVPAWPFAVGAQAGNGIVKRLLPALTDIAGSNCCYC